MRRFKAIIVIILLLISVPVFSWYSQLFPFNAGTYDEATVTFNARTWRLLDYSYTGYNLGQTGLRSGIPCTTINITGTGDITAELQAAVDTLEATGGRAVIPPGTFTISSRITVNRRNISIEGAGSGRTILNIPSSIVLLEGANDLQGVFTFEYTADGWNKGWPDRGAILSMVNGAIPEGSMYVTGLTNLANVAIGDWITLQQYWWQTFSQQNSASVWQYYPPTYNRETAFTYLRLVTNKDASGIYIDAPIPFHLDSANNPIHIKRSGPTAPSYQMLDNVGLSGVSIIFADNNTGTDLRPRGAGVVMESVVNGWVYDVHIYNYPRHGFYFEYDARISFINCSAKKTQDYGGDGYGYAYHNYGSQNILINNCYAEDVRHAYIFQKPLANYCVVANSESVDCRQGEDTHHSFSHAILRDNLRHKNGNKMVGYNRGTTSTNGYETYGTGVNWNVTGDGIGGVWESAIFSMNPAPYPAPYTHGIMVGGPDLYRVFDNGSHISGTYVEGDLISPAAGLQVGPNGDRNQLYEGLGQAGLQPLSLYNQQLINRLGSVPAVWDNTCGGGPSVPAATPLPNTGPNHLVFNSEHAAWGSNFGSACPLPLNTLTPGTNLDDLGQSRSSPEGLRVDVTAGSNWTPMFVFGGPDLNTASYLSVEMWIYPTNAATEFYLNLMNDDAGTTLGNSVTVNGTYAQGGAFIINMWNRVTVPFSAFAYSGVFSGVRFARTASAPATFFIDDIYLLLNGTPTFTMTSTRTATINPTPTFTRTRTVTPAVPTYTFTGSVTGTFTRTQTPTHTRTNTIAAPTATFTRTQTPTHTRTNTVSAPTATLTRTATSTPGTTACKRFLAYYPYWVAGYKQDKIPYNRLTHICHAFVQPQADGTLVAPGGFMEPALLTNAHANGVKVLVSIGGADETARQNFVTIAASLALRTAFANNVEAFCRLNNYDGADIDWEFPQDDAQRTNQNLLLQAVRDRFNAAAAPAPSWEITMAVSPGNWYGQWNDYATLNGIVSFYNLMNYDYHGGWSPHSGHNAALYRGTDPTIGEDIDWTHTYMTVTRGVPASMLNLGLAFYGYRFPTSENIYDNCGGSCAGATQLNYTAVTPLIGAGWTYNYDAGSQVPYLRYDAGAGFITYDDPASITNKVNYALASKGYGGIFMWEITGDYSAGSQPLLDAMYNGYASYCGLSTPTNTPATTPTFTRTRTMTVTSTRTSTPGNTATNTAVITQTFTRTRTVTATYTRTNTPVITFTNTPAITQTFTGTRTSTGTFTRTLTPVITFTNTPANSSTNTPVVTATHSRTNTPVNTLTYTATASPTYTRSVTPSFTLTLTLTLTASFTRTPSFTRTASPTRTNSPDYSPTETWTGTPPTSTHTPTVTETETYTYTETLMPTESMTPTFTRTASVTATQASSATFTRTASVTATQASSATFTRTVSVTATQASSATFTRTVTGTSTQVFSPTFTRTPLPSVTITLTLTLTLTYSATFTPTATRTAQPSATLTSTAAPSATATSTVVPEGAVFELTDLRVYPNPVTGNRDLNISINLSQLPSLIEIKIYTVSLRLVRKVSVDNGINRGINAIQVPAREFGNMASGVYYYIITAKNMAGAEIKSAAGHLILIK